MCGQVLTSIAPMRGGLLAILLVLSACSDRDVPVRVSTPAAPAYRQVIAGNADKIFSQQTTARDVGVSPARPWVDVGVSVWMVCLRARIRGWNGQELGVQTLAVFIRDDQIVRRRRAEPNDGCDQASYEALDVTVERRR